MLVLSCSSMSDFVCLRLLSPVLQVCVSFTCVVKYFSVFEQNIKTDKSFYKD